MNDRIDDLLYGDSSDDDTAPAASVPSTARETSEQATLRIQDLLVHATTCVLPAKTCPLNHCDALRAVMRHSVTCGSCQHCEQLKKLVAYHQQNCEVAPTEHCVIPCCDALRRRAIGAPQATGNSSAPTVEVNGQATSAMEYGRLLQWILHAQACCSACCVVGQRCAETKSFLQQMNHPQAPARAKTFGQILSHHRQCLRDNNTMNCDLCKTGMRPMDMVTAAVSGELFSIAPSIGAPGIKQESVGTSMPPAVDHSTPINCQDQEASTRSPVPSDKSRAVVVASGLPVKQPRAIGGSYLMSSSEPDEQEDAVSQELLQASVQDLKREMDVLAYTGIDLAVERRLAMQSGMTRSRR